MTDGKPNFYLETILPAREELFRRFPKCFSQPRNALHNKRALKIGIIQDIITAAPDLDEKIAHIGVADYTRGSKYAKACVEGRCRIDLDGKYVGSVTEEEAKFTQERFLASKKGKKFIKHVQDVGAKAC